MFADIDPTTTPLVERANELVFLLEDLATDVRAYRDGVEADPARLSMVLDSMVAKKVAWSPTLSIYEASRDVMAQRTAEWHDRYTLPSVWSFYQPSREAHGSYWFDWTTADEVAWKDNYRRWMTFVNEYKNRGGRVCTGSDAGFIYKLYGFGYVTELELLQEAGFHPLEVVRDSMEHALASPEPKRRPRKAAAKRRTSHKR